MDRDEALSILGLEPSATVADAEAKYVELYNDLHLRLTNAPTPNLKKLYQRNLEELKEALRVVAGQDHGTRQQDLPSSTPVYQVERPSPAPSAAPSPRNEPPPVSAPAPAAAPAPRKGLHWGIMVGAAVLLVAGSIGGTQWYNRKAQEKAAAMEKARQDSLARAEAIAIAAAQAAADSMAYVASQAAAMDSSSFYAVDTNVVGP